MYDQIFCKTALFKNMQEGELDLCLKELHAKKKQYKKDTVILPAGGRTDRMGLVLSGSVTIENNDIWGNRTILSHIGPGQFFAETYAMLPGEVMPVDVRANEDSLILFLTVGGLFTPACSSGKNKTRTASERIHPVQAEPGSGPKDPEPEWQETFTRNLLLLTARKNLVLSGRIFHTSPKSCRGRLLSYLNTVSLQKQSSTFDIPFDRQQLADYLNLDRTSLSKELGRMRREGILRCRKNHFTLLTELSDL